MNVIMTNVSVSFALSSIITTAYYLVNRKNLKEEMILTLLLLPIIVTTIIYTIGDNVAGAFSLAGIFSLVRFRSTQSSPKDITFILFGVAGGLTSAATFYKEGFFLIIFGSIVIFIYEKFNMKEEKETLRLQIPAKLQNTQAIENILEKHTTDFYLQEIQSKNTGELLEYIYKINLKSDSDELIYELNEINEKLPIKILK